MKIDDKRLVYFRSEAEHVIAKSTPFVEYHASLSGPELLAMIDEIERMRRGEDEATRLVMGRTIFKDRLGKALSEGQGG